MQLVTQSSTTKKRTLQMNKVCPTQLPPSGERGLYFLKKNCNTKNNTILTTISNT
jgi:hypothetical protein